MSFQFSIAPDGIASVLFDLPGEKVNKLSRDVLKELDLLLEDLRGRQEIKALLFLSGKKNHFIAGADLNEFVSILKDPSTAQDLLKQGRETLHKFSTLPFPTIALIHGACVGGGLELALFCTHRIVTDHPKTSLSFPETSIGIIPGWGGTQTAPRLMGLRKGTEMVVTGKPVSGKEAYKCHLADQVATAESLEKQGREFALRILKGEYRRKNIGLLNPLGRAYLFYRFKKAILQKTKGFYPAPLTALDVIKKSCALPLKQGLQIELDALSHLLEENIDIPRNLISLFFGREKLKKTAGYTEELPSVSTPADAALLGAGTMGGDIAFLFAKAKIPLRLKDINWEMICKGLNTSYQLLQKLIRRKKLKQGEAEIRFHDISWTLDYRGFEKKDFVLEAIVENFEHKQQAYQQLEEIVSKETIIATNTSSLRVSDLCNKMKHPERFIGMHFFNPPSLMPLVEIIKGPSTTAETLAKTLNLAKKIGKIPLVVQDCNGFLLNRILLVGGFEALLQMEKGASIEEIDKAALSFGLPLGLCELIDFTGLDICYHVAQILQKAYGERMAPPTILIKLYEAKLLGKKSNRGFYLYRGKSKKVNPEAARLIESIQTETRSPFILERVLLAMINEASRCLEEQIVTDPAHIDLALVLGAGFPPFRGGILAYADTLGLKTIYDKLKNLQSPRFKPTTMIEEMARKNQTFHSR